MFILAGCLVGCGSALSVAPQQVYSVFAITPDKISLNRKFHVFLPKLHPAKMSIRDPDGTWHWIQDAEEKITFMPDTEFREATNIVIDSATLQGVSWVDGRKSSGLVFRRPGEYLIYIANNLETEPENTFHFMGRLTVTK